MGKGGDRSEKSNAKTEPKEVLIDGFLYDVSGLKHPGGSVIDFYAGKEIDATQAFENFHIRSAKAQKYLKNLPSRPADQKKIKENSLPGQQELLKDFEELTNQLIKEGYFKPSLAHAFYRIAEVVLLYVVGAYLVLYNNIPAGIFLMAIGQGRCGWLMHEGGHYSLTGKTLFLLY